MTCQKLINVAFKALITLALLVLMMTPPVRISNSFVLSNRQPQFKATPSTPKNQFSSSKKHSPVIRATLVISRAVTIKAILSDNEEQRLSEPCSLVSFSLVVSPVRSCPLPTPNLAGSGLRFVNQPLRC
jgi:hypothetical protein